MAKNNGVETVLELVLLGAVLLVMGPALLSWLKVGAAWLDSKARASLIPEPVSAEVLAARSAARNAYLGPYSPEWYADPSNLIAAAGGAYIGPYSLREYEEAAADGVS